MLNPEYIIGLIDGEGSFSVYVYNGKLSKRKRRVRIEPKFCVKFKEEDKSILYDIKKFFNCGNIYLQKDNRPNHKNCYRYEVSKRKDLLNIIIPFFKKYPLKLNSKQKDFFIFCKIINEIELKKHLTSSGLAKLYQLKQKMH